MTDTAYRTADRSTPSPTADAVDTMAPASVGTVEHGPVPWNGHERGSREYRRILFALLCAGIATFAQLYSPQGILPGLAHDLHVDPSRASLAVSAATLGLAVSVLPWSLVADRIGRVAAMRASLIAATTLGLLMPWSPSFEVLMVIRVLEGVALGGIPAIAVVYLGEEIVRHHAAVAAGTYVAGTTIGGLLGRLVSGPVATVTGWRTGTFAVALLATVTATVFFLCTPAPRGFTPRPVSVTRVLKAVAAHLRNPRLLVLYAQGFLLMGGFVAVYNYLAFRLEAPPYLMPSSLASLLFLAYLSGTVSSRVAGGIVQRLGRRRVLLGSVAVMILGVLLTLDAHLPVVIVGIVVMTMGFFGAHSIASGWSGARAEHDRAQAASLYNLWYYVGSSVFGYLGGLVYVALGWPGLVAMVVVLAAVAGGWALFAARD